MVGLAGAPCQGRQRCLYQTSSGSRKCAKQIVRYPPGIAPHDLRRTCAKLCRAAGGDLEQFQMQLGHASMQTTERYLGTKQDLVQRANDGIMLRLAV